MHDTAPLAGVCVVDLSRLLPGPLATRHLLHLGAEVLKVEGPADQGQDDGSRHLWVHDDERATGDASLMFRRLNDGKQLHTLDLRTPAGVDGLHALLARADVLVEGFRPGVMARLGFGWEALQARYPRLVLCSISGYGQHSAWSQRAGHDLNYIAMAGVLEQLATPEGELVTPNFQIADLLGGTQAAVSGILAALIAVQRTGQGRWLDVSMTHEVLRHQVLARLVVEQTGQAPRQAHALLSGGAPCYGVYATADARHLAVGALEWPFWQRLCDVVGHPEWAAQHWSLGLVVGGEASMRLREALAQRFAQHTLAEWLARFETVDCCVTPVLRLDEALAHPLHQGRAV